MGSGVAVGSGISSVVVSVVNDSVVLASSMTVEAVLTAESVIPWNVSRGLISSIASWVWETCSWIAFVASAIVWSSTVGRVVGVLK